MTHPDSTPSAERKICDKCELPRIENTRFCEEHLREHFMTTDEDEEMAEQKTMELDARIKRLSQSDCCQAPIRQDHQERRTDKGITLVQVPVCELCGEQVDWKRTGGILAVTDILREALEHDHKLMREELQRYVDGCDHDPHCYCLPAKEVLHALRVPSPPSE
jgi:RNase P subunit RPR2